MNILNSDQNNQDNQDFDYFGHFEYSIIEKYIIFEYNSFINCIQLKISSYLLLLLYLAVIFVIK